VGTGGTREKRGPEAVEEQVGSGRSEREEIGRKMHNVNFCHVLNVKILSKTRTQNVI